jgi:hypothetical protein
LAAKIFLELRELVDLPDDATMAWNKRCIADGTEGLPVVDTVATP